LTDNSNAETLAPGQKRDLTKMIEISKAPAISRAAAILRVLGKSEQPMGVHGIARELGFVPSTCLHILRALVLEEFVAFDDHTKRYSLDAGLLTLTRQWLKRNRFTDIAQPVLDRIGEAHSVTALGVRIVGLDHIVVVGSSQPGPTFQLSTQIGSRFPAIISATGRCIAAFGNHPMKEVEARFKKIRWDEPPTLEEWRAQVAEAREKGFAVDSGYFISGVTVIAAPVWDSIGRLNHALVVIGLGSILRRSGMEAIERELLAGAQAISRQLGRDGL
jgi:DNA-binding IclR family transcriptional regulator